MTAPRRKSFGDFIAGGYRKIWLNADQSRRLDRAADDIDGLEKLQTWARHRWPTWYVRNSGDKFDGPTGKQTIALLWADYLAWAEAE